ncbi:hypothetical protein IQ247_28405 [Plectonema cf. radiosum LEGE 06105]|uniref:Pepco domain-containing protein n=1 Tax=Plectonema cf. radiosum LEGE 06105 TaxID=945769 RepID=A0A8J7FNP3_9CYAN|nr:hypothetical protein [Plectonema radiosum]MBE9216536.1 hypothetical protein [Plectonema cf. radiosum LEGE 06105]
MPETIETPKKIWIITEDTSIPIQDDNQGSRDGSRDIGGIIGRGRKEIAITQRKPVEVARLKEEMKGFLQAMREMLDDADEPSSKMQLDEVELSVEINGEGQISLLGIGGGKAGGKGAMTFKFKRK